VVSEEGAAFLERCRGLLADWNQAEDELADGQRTVDGHLIVSAPAAFGRMHVAPHAPGFLVDKPALQMSFNLNDRVADLIREGYDLSIRIGGAVDQNFVAVKLADNRRVVCGTPAYFKKHGKPKSLDDLPRHNCLAFNLQGGQNRGWYFRRNGKLATVRVAGNLDCNDGELLHRWVSEGHGLGWRSTWEIQRQLATGELETVLDEFALPDYDILAVYPQQRYVPAKVRYFIDYLKKIYAQPDYWNRER
jgi:DNA-binding transcriptional LysR family regulator